jgi:glycerophosphoryl diester phosphodiesterase
MLPGQQALKSLANQAFRPGHDYSMMPILVSGFNLWDKLDENPEPVLKALASSDTGEADWAEWALVKAGPKVLPAVRSALAHSQGKLRQRLIQILAWQADQHALPILQSLRKSDQSDRGLIDWAIATIQIFRATSSTPEMQDTSM